MTRLFLGKISKAYPQQFERNFYGGGKKGSSWYGGLEVGDYVFPVFDSSVSRLWRVKGYTNEPNEMNSEGSVRFEVVKQFEPVRISSVFARYKYFTLDINLLNKLTKSTGNVATAFFPISTEPGCPLPEDIDLSDTRNIFVSVEQPFTNPGYKEGDVRVVLKNSGLWINSIEVLSGGKFKRYDPLHELYLKKNAEAERYSLDELLGYAMQDNAEKKKDFIKSVIEELKRTGYFLVGSPISLYDNILVGRKKTKTAKGKGGLENNESDLDSESVAEATEDFKDFVELLDSNPNLILYGPPGTGKTYSASRIIEAFDHYRCKTSKTFKQIETEGRVDFITFHQSFSYEEFVEGLRPSISNGSKSQNEDEDNNLQYKIQDGILKQIANRADLGQIKNELKGEGIDKINEGTTIWKISLGRKGLDENIYKDSINSNTIAIGFLKNDLTGWDNARIFDELKKEKSWKGENPINDTRSIDYFINEMEIGDVVLVFDSVTTIRAIAVVTGGYRFDSKPESYRHKRDVKWLKEFTTPVNILKYNGGVRLTLPTLYPLTRMKFSDIKEFLEIGKDDQPQHNTSETPYYLIIDEINRGNISKIFGELITLVEKDKRNTYSCKLPYSQKSFSLPSNLYIIGTMNTADRSIAVLDIALRRRFYFKEIEPDVSIIEKENTHIFQHVDLKAIFLGLNSRIVKKLDRDHRIGHSHFLKSFTVSNLRLVWYYQIIPLLSEYFYNDANSIAEVIGDRFIERNTGNIQWIADDDEFKKAISALK